MTPKGMDEARKRIENILGRTINLVQPEPEQDEVDRAPEGRPTDRGGLVQLPAVLEPGVQQWTS